MGAEALATASEQDPGLAAESDKMPKRSSPSLLSAAHLEAMTECQSYASLPSYKQVRRLPTASSDFSLSDSEDDDDDGTSSVLSSCGSSASEESLLSCASSRAVPDAGDHRELKPQEHSNDRYLSGDALSTHADAAIPAHVKRSLSQMPYPVDPGQLAQLNVPTTNDLDEALRSNGLLAYVPSTDIGLQKPAQHQVSFTEVLACTSVNTLYVNLTSYLPNLRPGERSECDFFLVQAKPAATTLPTGQSWAFPGGDLFSGDMPLASCPCFMCKARGCSSAPVQFGTHPQAPPGSPGSFESEVSRQKLLHLRAFISHLLRSHWKLSSGSACIGLASLCAMHYSRHLLHRRMQTRWAFLSPSFLCIQCCVACGIQRLKRLSGICRNAASGPPSQAPWQLQQRWQLERCHSYPGAAAHNTVLWSSVIGWKGLPFQMSLREKGIVAWRFGHCCLHILPCIVKPS